MAAYDSQRTRPIDVCYGKTCEAVLSLVKAWATADGQPQMMWLSGLAGTGKSTLAKTIATWADDEDLLGSSYFFSRDVVELSKSSLVIPMIAYHLSKFDPSLAEYVTKRLVEKDNHVLYQEIEEQFRKLIEEPLCLTHALAIPRKRMLVVVDALDECNSPKAVGAIINCLSKLLSTSTSHIRLFLVGRPEKYIRDALYVHDQLHQNIVHHTVEDFVKTTDIEEYLHHELSKLGQTNWPKRDDFNSLVKYSGKLFIYASTAIGFVSGGRALGNPVQRLKMLLSFKPGEELEGAPYKQLDDLYLRILVEAVEDGSQVNSKAMARFRKILGTIVLLRDPLPVTSLAKLIEEDEQQIWTTLEYLGSILIVPPSNNRDTPPRFFHPSLPDFLTDAARCKDQRFFIDVPNLEAYLFRRCLEIITKGLSGNVEKEFIPVMSYTCEYWAYHLEKAHHGDAQVMAKLHLFIRCHLLKWIKIARILQGSCFPLFSSMEVARDWVVRMCNA